MAVLALIGTRTGFFLLHGDGARRKRDAPDEAQCRTGGGGLACP
jgi:hypothetical protein